MVDPDFYDAELRRHNEHLRAAADVQPGDRVLDIGCGAGQTTRQAAQATQAAAAGADGGFALGVDVSAAMLERARQRSRDEGVGNVRFEEADATTHPFPPAGFDRCISRFGTMFFADPIAAFTNIGRALRPGGRLALLVWQPQAHNEWAATINEALRVGPPPPPSDPAVVEPGAFSLGDPAVTRDILHAAGFDDIEFVDVHEPVCYGPDVDAAYDAVLSLWQVKELVAGLDAPTAERALERLRAAIAAHDTGDGVLFDSRSWIVTAEKGSP